MEVNAGVFKEAVFGLLDTLYEKESGNIDAAAKLISDCIMADGVVHVFGSGHSVGLGIDIKNRIGALVPIHIMETNDFVKSGAVTLAEFKDKDNVFERRADVADRLYNLYDIKPQDVFIVISNSGINGVVIDIASLAKANGHKVIICTCMNHTNAEASRHPSGKKLYEFGDVVIDNCGPHGDALLPTDGIAKVCSVSSICNNAIAQSMAAKIIENLNAANYPLPIMTGDPDHDQALQEKYKGRA